MGLEFVERLPPELGIILEGLVATKLSTLEGVVLWVADLIELSCFWVGVLYGGIIVVVMILCVLLRG